jgi:hypothetical protein
MALKTRALPDEILFAVVAANNQNMTDNIASLFHLDRTAATPTTGVDYKNPSTTRLSISSANASSLSTSVTLVNELKTKINVHFADSIAHNTAVSAAISTATATDLATGITLGNAIKAAYGTHLSAANVHFTNDSTNTIAAADATDQTSLNTLLNELKADLNLHMASAPKGVWIDLTAP